MKVWYSPSYATRMGARLLEHSKDTETPCTTNILKQVSFDYGIKLQEDATNDIANNNYLVMASSASSSTSSSEITLPPINSIMKTPSPNYNNIDFDNLILMAKNEQMSNGIDFMDMYQMNLNDQITSSDSEKMTQSPTSSYVKSIKFTEMHDTEAQKFACETCGRKYITKSNLEKHMRSHDLFMCVVCMKVKLLCGWKFLSSDENFKGVFFSLFVYIDVSKPRGTS